MNIWAQDLILHPQKVVTGNRLGEEKLNYLRYSP